MNEAVEKVSQETPAKPAILHVCKREILRPIRDQILRISGYTVMSTCDTAEALAMFNTGQFALILIDVEAADGLQEAERLCSEVKTRHHGQAVAFVCNWRVAVLTDCPDEVLRTEFDPAAFVAGVHHVMANHPPQKT